MTRLQKFRAKVEEVYKEGLKRGKDNFADFVIRDNIARTIFME
ncbi:MAG: hypothetical protein PVI03_04240 [Candidatus Thorarchaeota archaeon]|jgi:hypothetical protein